MRLLRSLGPTRVGALAEQVGAVPSTFTRSVDRMVSGGWVARAASAENRREILLDLTAAGRELVDSVSAARSREIRDVLDRVPAAKVAAVADAFALFAEAAGEPTVSDLLTLGL